ncbi:IclR family transcriptional regulator [Streptomyces sp. 4F14]|uniref:IclR family transcriptional regulator n=1 Tax=Streptomyces sp. 4F14 TaxID=3394380 RepID=UPI003A8B24B4
MTGNENPNASGTSPRLFDRFIRIQDAFSELRGEVHGTGEIAQAAGLDDSTTSRILQAGAETGFFDRVGRGRYRLGVGAVNLGMQALAHTRAKDDETHSALEELREATDGGLVFEYLLAPFGGAQRQCIDMAVGDSDLVELGMTALDILSVTRSLRTGASGRTILAHLPRALQEPVLAEPVPAEAGPGVYRDDKELLASLEEIRDRGYALGFEECMPYWNSCAAPILWDNSIMGAVLLLKPATVMPKAPESVIEATKAAASRISARLNHLSESAAVTLSP